MPPKCLTLTSRWIFSAHFSTFQLCAGRKIAKKPTPLFFTYSGEGRAMKFTKLKNPIKGWKPAHMEVSSIGKDKVQRQTEVLFSRLCLDWTS